MHAAGQASRPAINIELAYMIPPDTRCTEIVHLDRVEISAEPWSWEFAAVCRGEIKEHFADLQRKGSAVRNGRVLLLRRYLVRDGVFYGLCFDTDYASFIAWRGWNFPDMGLQFFRSFSVAGSDGAYLVGEMAPYTAGARQLYFPCGTPDPSDLNAFGSLDLTKHLCHELREETGVDIDELDAEPAWILVRDRSYVARRLLSPSLSAREISGLGWVSIIFSFPSSKFAHAIMKAKWGFACVKNVGHCQMYVLANMPSLHGD
jgi:hypothetical protein